MTEPSQSLPYHQNDFPPAEFAARRAAVARALGEGAVAVLRGAPGSGAFDLFHQTNEFYYLCGVEVPHAYLLIHGGAGHTVLYLPAHDPHHERSEGPVLHADSPDLVCRLTGVDAVRPLAALEADLKEATVLYTPFQPGEGRQACRDTLRAAHRLAAEDPWTDARSLETRFREQILQLCPGVEVTDLSPTLDALRLIKSPREVEQMRRAGELTARAVAEAMRSTRAGLHEFHLAAVADYLYQVDGSRGGAYRPIVATGANIWSAHYYRNQCELRDGELVLMDYAPDYRYYTSDIGRMWPVNGQYSPLQRELYGYIVEYHKVLLEYLRPGVTPETVLAEAADRMRPLVESTAWSNEAYYRAAQRTLEFRGHLSHPVGMAVHDVGAYFGRPMEPGLVFALDPQMWIPEEELYIRVEDTVAITETGVEVLTAAAPLELADVEAWMHGPGLLQAFPPLFRPAAAPVTGA